MTKLVRYEILRKISQDPKLTRAPMRLTTRRRYAVTAMLDIALNQAQGPVALSEIAKRQGISQTYLEQLFSKLRQKALVKSIRGSAGGYCIEKELNELTVAEVINAIEEKQLEETDCRGLCSHQDKCRCLTQQLWQDLSHVIYDFLNNVTFEDLVKKEKDKNESPLNFIKLEK